MFSGTSLTGKSNGLEEECSGETSAACKAEAKPKEQAKEALEETQTGKNPLKKKKKKRKLVQTDDSPGNT